MLKITAGKGNFRVKHMASGNYTAKIVKTGYREQALPVTIMDDEMTEL